MIRFVFSLIDVAVALAWITAAPALLLIVTAHFVKNFAWNRWGPAVGGRRRGEGFGFPEAWSRPLGEERRLAS